MGNYSWESLLPLVEYRVSDEILGQTITIADGSGSVVYPPVFSLDLYGLPEELWDDVITYYENTYGVTVDALPSEEVSSDETISTTEPPSEEAASDSDGEETAAEQAPAPSLAPQQ